MRVDGLDAGHLYPPLCSATSACVALQQVKANAVPQVPNDNGQTCHTASESTEWAVGLLVA